MTAPQKPQDDVEVLLDTFLAELMDMTDAQVLDGLDPAAVQSKGLAMLSQAKQEAGRRRLATAKAKVMLAHAEARPEDTSSISAAEARAFLREAINSGSYTLAARGLDEMSDDDAIRIYRNILRLRGRAAAADDAP
jgi:hypothetical protein